MSSCESFSKFRPSPSPYRRTCSRLYACAAYSLASCASLRLQFRQAGVLRGAGVGFFLGRCDRAQTFTVFHRSPVNRVKGRRHLFAPCLPFLKVLHKPAKGPFQPRGTLAFG